MKLTPEQIIRYTDIHPPYEGRSYSRELSDWEGRVDMDKMRRDRLARWRQIMKERGITIMFLVDPFNQRYTMGYWSMAYTSGLSYALLPLEGEPILYAHGTCAIQNRRYMTWLKPENIRYAISSFTGGMATGIAVQPEVVEENRQKVVDHIKADLEDLKMTKEVLYLDQADAGLQAIFERNGIKIKADPLVGIIAQEIKTPEEIECMRIASAICDVVHFKLAEYAEPGMTEFELKGYMIYQALRLGAESAVTFAVSGENTWPNYRNMSNRMLRPGDIWYADSYQVSWNGYKTCYYRTYSMVYKPSQKALDAMKRISEWAFKAISEAKPGNTTADMVKHWPAEEKWQGLPADYCWGDNVFHGLGLINYGPPQGNRAWSLKHPYPLKEGHVFALETQDGIGDGQGVRLEEHCVITKDGCEVLSRWPADQIVVTPNRGGAIDLQWESVKERYERLGTGNKYPKGPRD